MSTYARRGTLVAVAATALALVAAGCSSNSSSKPKTSSGGASSDDIVLGATAPLTSAVYSEPTLKTGLEAAIASVNAAGGVAGHKLKLDFCDSQYTVNGELSCARKFVSDKVAVAMDPYFLADQSGTEVTLLQKAGIPVFGSQGLSPAELNNPAVYPLGSGLPGWTFGAVGSLLQNGVKKISILVDTNPGSQFAAKLIQGAVQSAGLSASIVSGDPNSDPTFATAAAKATAGGVDGVALFPSPLSVPKMIGALRQGGYTGKISLPTVIFSQPVITALGSAADGVLADSQVSLLNDTANPGVTKYLADIKQYGKNDPTDASIFAWSAVQVFAKAVVSAKSVDAKGITAALNSVSTPIDVGTVGPWQAAGVTSPLKDFSRILNPTVTYGVVQNGKLVSNGKGFINPFTELASLNK
ncbi:MAG TPA: ABC transporter substrate-binding protein [Jatrophihabitantaceae bacterium]|jgi:ABC-type branched-subunit amino acid transport system substrate-binding protein